MQDVQPIDPLALESVSGGTPGTATPPAAPPPSSAPNRVAVSNNLGVTHGATQVGLQTSVDVQRTNYARCLDRSERGNWSPAQTAAACGLPPS